MASKIRKGDLVQVISGADRGKQGRILAMDREKGRVRVERVRLQKRHLKQGRGPNRAGGVIEQEGFVDASNVMLVDAQAGKPSRVRVMLEAGTSRRVFVKSGADVPEASRR